MSRSYGSISGGVVWLAGDLTGRHVIRNTKKDVSNNL